MPGPCPIFVLEILENKNQLLWFSHQEPNKTFEKVFHCLRTNWWSVIYLSWYSNHLGVSPMLILWYSVQFGQMCFITYIWKWSVWTKYRLNNVLLIFQNISKQNFQKFGKHIYNSLAVHEQVDICCLRVISRSALREAVTDLTSYSLVTTGWKWLTW
jgi:hypothetical protein